MRFRHGDGHTLRAGNEDGYVYAASGSHAWLWTVVSLVMGTAFIGLAVVTVLSWRFERRR